MKKKNTVKCGEYWLKDGVVIKRSGKTFQVPRMPSYLKAPYPKYDSTSPLVFFASIVEFENVYDKVDQMNALKEQNWQRAIVRQHSTLRNLYYINQVKRIARSSVRKAYRGISRLTEAVVREYGD